MPSPAFFRKLGLFTLEGFFDASRCADLRAEMSTAPREEGWIVNESGERLLDERYRTVLRARPCGRTIRLVSEQLADLKERLEEHFHIALAKCEEPQFLVYNEGAFFVPHEDTLGRRRISVIVFLNRQATAPAPGLFGGGTLAFYGLVGGSKWELCPLPLETECGLLVAFPSTLRHEVRRVTFGQRFTIVTWFHGPE